MKCPNCNARDTYSRHDPPRVRGEWKCNECGYVWEYQQGRPHTSAGWATVSVRLPLPVVKAYRALSEEKRATVQAAMKRVIDRAVEER